MRLIWVLVVACGGQTAPAEPTTETSETRARAEIDPTPVELALDPSSEPVLRFWAEPADEGATLHVQNRGTEAVQLRSAVGIELEDDGTWTEVPVELALRMDCDAPVTECITLAPGAELVPPPWNGMRGHAQCECERCVALPAGSEVRFVLQSCAPEGTRPHEVRSEALAR